MDDSNFVRPTDRPYVRPNVVSLNSSALSLGPTGADLTVGSFHIDIFSPKSRPGGRAEIKALADQAKPQWRNVRVGPALFSVPSIVATGDEASYYGIKIYCPYRVTDFPNEISDTMTYTISIQSLLNHGFHVGNAIMEPNNWQLAIADSEANLAIGVVVAVGDQNHFNVAYIGVGVEVTIIGHGLGNPGQILYLSQTTPGAMISARPNNGWIQPICTIKDINTLVMTTPRASNE